MTTRARPWLVAAALVGLAAIVVTIAVIEARLYAVERRLLAVEEALAAQGRQGSREIPHDELRASASRSGNARP